jgi:hypothetical protein
MLTLPIRKHWWKMIYDGEKPEEDREIGDYWRKRFFHAGLLDADGKPVPDAVADVLLCNGYGAKAPQILARVRLRIGTGEAKWGAEPGREYYVLPILTRRRVR